MSNVEDVVAPLVWGALMPGVRTPEAPGWLAAAVAAGTESVCLFADAVGTPERVVTTTAALRALAPGLLVATDEEGGEVTRVDAEAGSPMLSARALGVIDDVAVTAAHARLLARRLRAVGVDWTFAPVADVNVDPRNPVIGVRSFGADAGQVAAHVAATVQGLQGVGIIATAKHFPGHGDTHVDSHEDLPTLDVAADVLAARELEPFRAAVAVGVATVMTGHLRVPAIDPREPASLSAGVTTGLLRERLAFAGAVVTDAVEMGAVSGPRREHLPAAVVAALRAGADVVCLGAEDQEHALVSSAQAVLAAVAAGDLPVARLVEAARRRAALRTVAATYSHAEVAADVDRVAHAAASSLAITGTVGIRGRRIDLLTVAARPGYAAGPTGWQLGPRLVAAGFELRDLGTAGANADAAGGRAGDRALVVAVRDAWKDPVLAAQLAELLTARPDAVVVDLGWPVDPGLPVRGRVVTHGTGALAATLAACVLAGEDPAAAARALIDSSVRETP